MTRTPARKRTAKTTSLTIERLFDASPKTLWSYWTDPEKFAKWFNPAPSMDLVVHEYDVRVGGRVRFDMPQPDGNANPQEGVFHVLTPYREIVSGAPDTSFLIRVRFAKVGKRTRMTVTVTGVPRKFHAAARKGWNAGFDKLAGLLRSPASAGEGLVIERTFEAPIERLWALWTTKEGIEAWWGPEGFTTTVPTIDLRRGGAFDYEMTATGPDQVAAMEALGMPRTSVARNVFTDIVAPRRLALRTRIDFVPGVAAYDLTTEVEFRAGRGGTKLTFRSSKMHSEQWKELARQGQMSQLDKLARLVAAEAASGSSRAVRVTLPSEREILIARVFDAPPARVFQAHMDPKAMEEWWGPRDYATTVETYDVRPGGAWRIVQRTPEGTEHGFHGVFTEVVPPERLGWTFEYEGTPGKVVTETVTFEARAGGRTELTVRAVFANQGDRDGMINAGMEWGLRQGYERLDELLARLSLTSSGMSRSRGRTPS